MKLKKKLWSLLLALLGITFLMAGCKFEKILDISDIEFENGEDSLASIVDGEVGDLDSVEKMSNILVELGPKIDGDAVLQYFYGQGLEELQDAEGMSLRGTPDDYTGFYCEKDGQRIDVIQNLNGNQSTVEYIYLEERAGEKYMWVTVESYRRYVFSNRLQQIYKKGELETCSSQEALDACAPLAEACGYGNAKADVYVMTHEAMNTMGEALLKDPNYMFSAPNPDYDYEDEMELLEQIEEAKEAGNEELANQLYKEYLELLGGEGEQHIDWTKEKEAYLIVYRSTLNGLLLDSTVHGMICIYVPYYGQVVYAKARQSLNLLEVQEEQELISKRAALQEAVRILGLTDGEGLTVTNISLVYSPRIQDIQNGTRKKKVPLCWRIDYHFSEAVWENNPDLWVLDLRTILIDAVDGTQVKYSLS